MKEKQSKWIRENGSGTLRRAVEEDMAWHTQYLHERAAFEVGAGFDAVHASRLTTGKAQAEPDSPSTTETCWFARVLRWRLQRLYGEGAKVQVVYAYLDSDGEITEGMALLVTGLDLDWLPSCRVLVAFTCVFEDGEWADVVNPC